jgi:TatD DNase family protein
MVLVDSHAHLEGRQFDNDREQVIARAREAGVRIILAIGNGDGPATLDCALKLSRQYDFIYASVGIHPHEARLADEAAYQKMDEIASQPKVLAWGEIGLDYFYDHSPRDVQKTVFIRQMEQARAAKLPIIIHCRPSQGSNDAWDDTLDLIGQHWQSAGFGGILHCFTGEWAHAERALNMGFMISFSGNITFPKAQGIRDVAARVPLERVFIETDCPYLAPVPFRGKRNEPAYVKETARRLAELRGLSPEEVGHQTAANFCGFFSLPEKL